MGRFQRSALVAKQSFAILRSNPQLMLFPIVSSILTLLVMASLAVPAFLSGAFKHLDNQARLPLAYYIGLFVFYLVTSFVVIFFNSGLCFCAYENLNGRPATFSDGLRAASARIGSILGWAVISATVGMILRMISERSGLIGRIAIAIVGGVWSIFTFFVIPIIVVENATASTAVKKSTEMIKTTWGERLIASAGIGLFMFVLGLSPIPVIILSAFTGSAVVIIATVLVALVYWLLLAAVGASMMGIFSTALYMYASQGTQAPAYGADMYQSAFQPKPSLGERFSGWGR